jgi:DNA polymerase-3 subunit epsilon
MPVIPGTKMQRCLHDIETELPTFALIDDGLQQEEQSCILVEKGKFYGMGYLPSDSNVKGIEQLKNYLTPYVENDYIRGIIFKYAERFPYKKVEFDSLSVFSAR